MPQHSEQRPCTRCLKPNKIKDMPLVKPTPKTLKSKDPRRKQRGFQEEAIYYIGGICPPSPLTRMPFLPAASSGASWHDFVLSTH